MFTFCFILSKIKNNVKKSSNNQTKISKDSQISKDCAKSFYFGVPYKMAAIGKLSPKCYGVTVILSEGNTDSR